MKVFVESYGCTLNHGEGDGLLRDMVSIGHTPCGNADEADLIVLNTCTVVETTEIRMLRRLKEIREAGKEVVISGCMAKVQPQTLYGISPGSIVIPPAEYDDFENRFIEMYGPGPDEAALPLVSRTFSIPIAQGCMGTCTYCITRFARGALKSVPESEVLKRFESALAEGAREILLTSQDSACYGLDIDSDLPALLDLLLSIDGDHRIRIGMMNPEHLMPIKDRFLESFEDPRMYRFLHLPLQSGSDKVLEAMGRRYGAEDFLSLVSTCREKFPDLSLSTDMIVGFPGETDEDHRLSMGLMRKVSPDIINVTRFSPRPGTPASTFPERPHGRLSKARSREMSALRMELGGKNYQDLVGSLIEVMVTEQGSKGTMICRTDSYRPVVVPSGPRLGQRIEVELTGSAPTHLFGKPVN